ncbi:MAG: methionyl-tRNA formyltransferase [Eubacterium sp.]
MKIVFMGTPDFSVPCLKRLIENRYEVLAVFSQPDKPVGRKQIMTPPPVKAVAVDNGITVYQPQSLKANDVIEALNDLSPDVIIVVAYGKILPKSVLDIAKYGCINVHASILPYYRGAAPIQWSVLNGDKETGISIMQMNEGLDTGDVLSVVKTDIDINETSEELFERLSVLGADALIDCLEALEKGNIKPVKQPDGDFGYAQKITKSLSPIDWSRSAFEVHNKVRGLQTWPCAVTTINGRNVKIHKTVLSDKTGNKPGQVVDNKNVISVCCGDGKCVDILELQLEGKKKMDTKTFLLGNSVELNTVLGE